MTKGSEDKGNRKAALLLSGLVASSDDGLEAFRKRRLSEANEVSLERLGEMRDVLVALGNTLVGGDDAAWERFERARAILLDVEAEEEAEAPDDEEASEEPADSAALRPPRLGDVAEEQPVIGTSTKPSPWASPSASRPAPVAKRPSPMMPSPVPPAAPAPVAPAAVMPPAVLAPTGSSSPPEVTASEPVPPSVTAPEPGLEPPSAVEAAVARGTSPAPDSEPPPPSVPPAAASEPAGATPVSVTSDIIAATEVVASEQPVLPFRGGSPSASTPPKPGVPWGLPFARPGEAAPPPLDRLPLDAGPLDAGPLDAGPLDAGPNDPAFDFDEATTRRNIAARRRRTTTVSLDDSPVQMHLSDSGSVPSSGAVSSGAVSSGSPTPDSPSGPAPPSGASASGVDSTAIALEQGPALARSQAEGSHLSLAHYAVLCATCGAFPRRVGEAHAKFGIASRVARESLDRAWDTRFQQQPEAQELWQALVSRYRAMLVEHGGH